MVSFHIRLVSLQAFVYALSCHSLILQNVNRNVQWSVPFASPVRSRLFATTKSLIQNVMMTSTSASENVNEKVNEKVNGKVNSCAHCGGELASRNAVFCHLCSSVECSNRVMGTTDGKISNNNITGFTIALDKHKIVLQFGYHLNNDNNAADTGTDTYTDTYNTSDTDNTSDNDVSKANEVAGNRVRESFYDAFRMLYPISHIEEGSNMLQCSADKLRHPSLSQDRTCSTWLDVLAINYRAAPINSTHCDLLQHINHLISDKHKYKHKHPANIHLTNQLLAQVRVIAIENLPVSTRFNAEQICSQRSYHYLLPLKWIKHNQNNSKSNNYNNYNNNNDNNSNNARI